MHWAPFCSAVDLLRRAPRGNRSYKGRQAVHEKKGGRRGSRSKQVLISDSYIALHSSLYRSSRSELPTSRSAHVRILRPSLDQHIRNRRPAQTKHQHPPSKPPNRNSRRRHAEPPLRLSLLALLTLLGSRRALLPVDARDFLAAEVLTTGGVDDFEDLLAREVAGVYTSGISGVERKGGRPYPRARYRGRCESFVQALRRRCSRS